MSGRLLCFSCTFRLRHYIAYRPSKKQSHRNPTQAGVFPLYLSLAEFTAITSQADEKKGRWGALELANKINASDAGIDGDGNRGVAIYHFHLSLFRCWR